jgi:hypothetical protein
VKRRSLISRIAGVATLWPLAGTAQERERVRRIGMLMGYAESDPDSQANLGSPEAGVGGGPQHTDRNTLGDPRRLGDVGIRRLPHVP